MGDKIGIEDVSQAREAWINAVQSRDVHATVALYDPKVGKLLGTLDTADSQKRDNPESIADYFRHFLANDKISVQFPDRIEADDIQPLGPGFAAYSGYYRFKLTKGGSTKRVYAKFTFIYHMTSRGDLRIATHNSGLTPQGIQVDS